MTTALVLGGAATVWEDAKAALDLAPFDGVVSCNDITSVWPGPIDACVSLHASSWPRWISQRDRCGFPRPAHVLGHAGAASERIADGFVTGFVEHRFPGQDRSGSSGLFALKVALIDLGFDKAVLCGVPMTTEGRHYFDAAQWRGAQAHRKGWEQAMQHIMGRARSMSGWTAEHLGQPDAAWLAS